MDKCDNWCVMLRDNQKRDKKKVIIASGRATKVSCLLLCCCYIDIFNQVSTRYDSLQVDRSIKPNMWITPVKEAAAKWHPHPPHSHPSENVNKINIRSIWNSLAVKLTLL